MKKAIFIVIALLAVGIVGVVWFVISNLDAIVERGIETYGSAAVGTTVDVEGVEIDLGQGTATVAGLTVNNPPDFDAEHAFELDSISVRMDPTRLREEPLVLEVIEVKAPEIWYELKADGEDNLRRLRANLERNAQVPEESTGEPPPQIAIDRFTLADAALHAHLIPAENRRVDLTVPSFTLTELTGTPAEIARQVVRQLIDAVMKEVQQEGIDRAGERVREEVGRRAQELEQEAAEKLKEKLGL